MNSKPFRYETKKALMGFLFVLPWLIGFIFFFLRPLVSSLLFSFGDVTISNEGLSTSLTGFENYHRAFVVDGAFIPSLTGSIGSMLYEVPIIVIFSLFVAYLLKAKFRGRTFVRAVFFLPVIVTTGIIIEILAGDPVAQEMFSMEQQSALLQAEVLETMLLEAGIPEDIVQFFRNLIDNIFELSWRSGIQILLFLAGLQTIPSSLYEASAMEGATGWESFWKITFPMVSPIILVNLVYSIIDTFTDFSNDTMRMIHEYARQLNLAYSAALSWIYFVIVFAILGLVYAIVNRHVFYQVK